MAQVRQEFIPILLVAILLLYCIIALFREGQRSRRHRLRVKKLYASPVFEEMLPMLSAAKKRHLEQVTIDKTGVLFTYMTPVGSNAAFIMKSHGFSYLTMEQQEAMRTLLEECLPKLTDIKRYRPSCRRVRLVNGDVEYEFRYIMQNGYKAMLARAPYYDAALQARSR